MPKIAVRTIKKYPNRRLYDTQESRYITISDIRDLIVENVQFKVIDSQSEKDISRAVLLQIIIEQESERNPLFTTDNLQNFIRYYGQNHQQAFSEYMNQSLAFFQHQQEQEQFHLGMQEMLERNPVNVFSDFNKKNAEMWQQMQEAFFANMGSNGSGKP